MSWYEVVEGSSLRQGDLLRACPVFVPRDSTLPADPAAEVPFVQRDVDAIILTQSCDLEQDNVREVLLAQVSDYLAMVNAEAKLQNEFPASGRFRKLLVDGNIPGSFLLRRHQSGNPKIEWSIVNFHRLYTLPKAFVSRLAAQAGPRLRLLSPYREFLGQSFGRYFMRVGLPLEARDFEKEAAVKKVGELYVPAPPPAH